MAGAAGNAVVHGKPGVVEEHAAQGGASIGHLDVPAKPAEKCERRVIEPGLGEVERGIGVGCCWQMGCEDHGTLPRRRIRSRFPPARRQEQKATSHHGYLTSHAHLNKLHRFSFGKNNPRP